MPEPEQPKILSLEEVRSELEDERTRHSGDNGVPDYFNETLIARLCATVKYWHERVRETDANWHLLGQLACSLGIKPEGMSPTHILSRAIQENLRLTSQVARLREALAEAGFPLEALNVAVQWELAPELKNGIREALEQHVRPVLADRDGERASEELRLLRAWETAQRKKFEAELSGGDSLERGRAIEAAMIVEEEAWAALDAFREKTL